MDMCAVVIAAAGSQRYIFESSRRAENVGASELITWVHGKWADEARAAVWPEEASGWRAWRVPGRPAQIITAGAGALTAIVVDLAQARALVSEVTRRALREAPGLDVCGAVRLFDWGCEGALAAALGQARAELVRLRQQRPGPAMRFAQLPVVEPCASSGLPAACLYRSDDDGVERPRAQSAASRAKSQARDPASRRMAADFTSAGDSAASSRWLRNVLDHLEDGADWLGVVHADGNGLGQIFASLDSYLPDRRNETFAQALRRFSEALESCARDAFTQACETIPADPAVCGGRPPVLPLVVGGDDLTFVCDAAVVLPLTQRYLRAFARLTAEHQDLAGPLTGAGRDQIGASAGVAIVKRHYPFQFAYRLAEELAEEAKTVKTRVGPEHCALSYHVLYESAGADLPRLRAGTTTSDGARLVAQPYALDAPEGHPWAAGRRWEDLVRRVTALRSRDPVTGERALPATVAHDLRAGLFLGGAVADARLAHVAPRLDGAFALCGSAGSLFWADTDGRPVTGLLDAMDAAEFLDTPNAVASAADGGAA